MITGPIMDNCFPALVNPLQSVGKSGMHGLRKVIKE
jgi:hypothetical protein